MRRRSRVFVARTKGGVRVAVTGAGPSVFRFSAAEAALAKRFDASALEGVRRADERRCARGGDRGGAVGVSVQRGGGGAGEAVRCVGARGCSSRGRKAVCAWR